MIASKPGHTSSTYSYRFRQIKSSDVSNLHSKVLTTVAPSGISKHIELPPSPDLRAIISSMSKSSSQTSIQSPRASVNIELHKLSRSNDWRIIVDRVLLERTVSELSGDEDENIAMRRSSDGRPAADVPIFDSRQDSQDSQLSQSSTEEKRLGQKVRKWLKTQKV